MNGGHIGSGPGLIFERLCSRIWYLASESIHKNYISSTKDIQEHERRLVDLESTRHQSLENSIGVILLSNADELLVVLLAIAGEDRLETSSVTHVVESVVETSLLGSVVDLVGGVLDPLGDDLVVSRSNPLDDLGVAKVDLRRVQAEGVSATGFGGLHPVSTDGLPVELDGGDVGGRDLLVQLRELVEEGLVDDGDSLEQFLVGCSLDGTGDEDVAIPY